VSGDPVVVTGKAETDPEKVRRARQQAEWLRRTGREDQIGTIPAEFFDFSGKVATAGTTGSFLSGQRTCWVAWMLVTCMPADKTPTEIVPPGEEETAELPFDREEMAPDGASRSAWEKLLEALGIAGTDALDFGGILLLPSEQAACITWGCSGRQKIGA